MNISRLTGPINMNKLGLYNSVCQWRPFHERALEGTMSSVHEAGDGWLIKSDIVGVDLVEREFSILLDLQGTGLCPEVDEDEGVFGHPSSFLIRKINNGATLGEYLRYFLDQGMNYSFMEEIFSDTSKKINEFHELGYVHGDLHDRNIVVGMDKGCKSFITYLIDFGYSFHRDEGPNDSNRTSIEDPEGDNGYLVNTLYSIVNEYTDVSRVESANRLINLFEGLLH